MPGCTLYVRTVEWPRACFSASDGRLPVETPGHLPLKGLSAAEDTRSAAEDNGRHAAGRHAVDPDNQRRHDDASASANRGGELRRRCHDDGGGGGQSDRVGGGNAQRWISDTLPAAV